MRPHSNYKVNAEAPRAKGVCDRCGSIYQHRELKWQFEWIGPRLQNLRFLVCPPCYDKPQPNRRTIVIPPDPLPILNPRTEAYVVCDNGMFNGGGITGSSLTNGFSGIGVSANFFLPQYGSVVGTLTGGGGLNSAFDANINKKSWLSAATRGTLDSSFNSYVGMNWQGFYPATLPSSFLPTPLTHSLSAVNVYAPTDRGFLDANVTSYVIQAGTVDTTLFTAWTTISSGTTRGVPGESISITFTSTYTNPLSQFHRVAFQGNGTSFVSVAQVQFAVNEVSATQNEGDN